MPEMDGFTLAEQIRARPGLVGASLMMLSSAGQQGDAARCRELGVAGYLTKPLRQSELLQAILSLLGTSLRDEEHTTLNTDDSLARKHKRLRLLVAEDNLVNQRLIAHLLEKHGHTVVIASNGREALAALEHEGFDLVLMDVQMPVMGGLEVTAAIREKEQLTGSRLPIIALTAHAMKGDRERCLAAGMNGYLSKPIQAKDLFEAIESLVSEDAKEPAELSAAQKSHAIIDQDLALAHLGGDAELLKEIAGVFLDECPRLISEIQDAIAFSNGQALVHAAHSLKGAVGNFGARAAYEAAHRLEKIGREGDLTCAPAACQGLEEEVVYLQRELTRLVAEPL